MKSRLFCAVFAVAMVLACPVLPAGAVTVTVDATHSARIDFNSPFAPFNSVLGDLRVTFPGNALDSGESIAINLYDANDSLLLSLVENGTASSAHIIFSGTLSPVLTTSTVYVLLSAIVGSVELDDTGLQSLSLSCLPPCSPPVGLSVIASSEESITATPIPAALPLFATGLGVLGLLGWRRKRKSTSLAA